MIPTKIDRDILRSGEFIEHSMGVAEGSEAFIFNVLRNSLYQDKMGSPLREYLANAIDEHVKAGIPHIPVEVTFPNVFSNELRVRDYGFGLSDENVIKFFSKYGASDKRESNNLIGAFGLGCKSAFAYTDSFTVVSFFNGTKTTFNLYIDETEVGKIAKLTSGPTKEKNGIEIIIPIKSQDVNTFVQRGLALIKYFKTKPLIKGVANVPDFTREASPVAGKDWKYFGDGRGSVIIQGQIGYPLEIAQMGSVAYYLDEISQIPAGQIREWEHSLLSSGLEIEVPIGDVEVTASREALQMTPKTIAAIRKRLEGIRGEIVDLVSKEFKSAKTLVEAKTAYYNFFQKGGSYGRTLHKSIGTIKWNGEEITDSTIRLKPEHRVMQYSKKYNGDIILTAFDKIQCSDDLHLYYDDTDRTKVNYKRRAKTLLDAGAKQVTIIQTENVKTLKKETGLDVTKLDKYSKIVPTVLVSTRVGSGVDLAKRVKHKMNVFELDWAKLSANYVRGSKSNYWKVVEIEIDTQVFVPIDRFEPKGCFDDSLSTMREILNYLVLLGIDVAKTPIYGLKAKQDSGDMVRLDKWVEAQAKTLPNLAHEVAWIKDFNQNNTPAFTLSPKKLKVSSLSFEYATEYQLARKLAGYDSRWDAQARSLVNARLSVAQYGKLEITDLGKLQKLAKSFDERYPLVKYLINYQTTAEKAIVDYINLVDEARDAEDAAIAMAAAA